MCYLADDLETWEFYRETRVQRARKAHRCCECGADIPVGEPYTYAAGGGRAGGLSSFRWHDACGELRDFVQAVMCDGEGIIPFGGLAEECGEVDLMWRPDPRPPEWVGPMWSVLLEIQAHYQGAPRG